MNLFLRQKPPRSFVAIKFRNSEDYAINLIDSKPV